MKTKRDLRQEALQQRDAIDPVSRVEASLALAAHASSISCLPGETVAGYIPIRSEIDPRPLMHEIAQSGISLASPVLLDRNTMVFRALQKDAPLVDAGFGTRGPAPEAPELQPDIVLLPLAAFDANGNRLGYGAGHYDRAIARLRSEGVSPRLIGLAYAAQEMDAVPSDPHDMRLEAVLTENGLRVFVRRA